MSPSRKHSNSTLSITGLGLAAAATAVSAMAFSSGAYADNVSQAQQRIGASVPTNSVSIATDGDVNLNNIIPTENGSLAVGKSKITVTTDAPSGYKLYVSGVDYEPDTKLTSLNYQGQAKASSKLKSIAATTPTAFTAANQWGVAVGGGDYSAESAYESAVSTTRSNGAVADHNVIDGLKWHGVGKDITELATKAASNKDTYVYYGIYIDNSTMTGSYQNSVVYTAFAEGSHNINVTPYAVKNNERVTITAEYQSAGLHFNANQISVHLKDGDTQVGTCGNLEITNDGSTGLLEVACDITKVGTVTNNKLYDIALSIDLGGGKTLEYSANDAWKYAFPLNELTYMQDVSAESCANTPLYSNGNASYTLTDNRDNKKYVVRKLADGNCWMTQNLDLDLAFVSGSGDANTIMGAKKGGGSTEVTKLTNDNTDIRSSEWKIPSGSKAYATQTTVGTNWNATGMNGSNANSYEIRSMDNGDNCFPHTAGASTDTGVACAKNLTEAANAQHEGNMYNWPAATAGSFTNQNPSSTDKEAPDSICPKGWQLPYGDANPESKSWYNLISKYTDISGMVTDQYGQYKSYAITELDKLLAAPLSEVRPGYYYYSSAALDARGTNGYGWSSTADSSGRGWYLLIYTSYVRPGTHVGHRGNGFQVRCVAR